MVTACASAAYDRVDCAFARSAASWGSAHCVSDAPQPHPQRSLPGLAASDNDAGASIVKGSHAVRR